MSQTEKSISSSSNDTGVQRKRVPMSDSEKQMAAVARKRVTHKEIKVFVRNPLKDIMIELCNKEGLTQAQFVEALLENELRNRGLI